MLQMYMLQRRMARMQRRSQCNVAVSRCNCRNVMVNAVIDADEERLALLAEKVKIESLPDEERDELG